MNLDIEKITFLEPDPPALDSVTQTNGQDQQQPPTLEMKVIDMRYPLKDFNPIIRMNGQEPLEKPTLEMKVVGVICPLKDIHQLEQIHRQRLMLKLYQNGILRSQEKGEKTKMPSKFGTKFGTKFRPSSIIYNIMPQAKINSYRMRD